MRFDLETFKERSERVTIDDLDLGSFRRQPLSAPALRCIRYMHDVEHHTVCYLRDLLVGPAHADPHVTEFLTIWSYEELWHGEALGKVLAAHGEPAGPARTSVTRARDRGLRPWSLAVSLLGRGRLGEDVTALHLTWGAVNEWTTQAGYARLIAREPHPVLVVLLRRLMRQEGRHIDFYASEAAARLERSGRARRLARFALSQLWQPVGTSVMPAEESAFVARWLFDGPEGLAAAQRIDRRIDRLPGLQGLGLVQRARDRHHAAEPTAPTPVRPRSPRGAST
ncbi:hypothetical protein [Rhabdothermincola sediminis]|uniref:hypothetical protein n=1 Tax=Rhabdothermincola sediminis TaxID=2751370 RepID=UPI001AA05890|nr:hypothetical protein [Rhabdothermincola sediminis]